MSESETKSLAFELAMKYYPRCWKKERLDALLHSDPPMITQEEYDAILEKENH